jgi:hypothetical protein
MGTISPIKLDKKQEKLIKKVQEGLSEINNYGIPIDMLNLKFQRDASTTAQLILSDSNPALGNDLLSSITGANITIPPVMAFRY